jgi:hypothetical protein
MSGSTQQFPNVFAGAAGSASRVYSSDNIMLQRASNNICGDAPTNPAPQNSYVVTQPCPEYCTDSNYSATVVNNHTNPYLPAVDTYYALKNPCVPSIDQNQKHSILYCNNGCINETMGSNCNIPVSPPVINPVWNSLSIGSMNTGGYIQTNYDDGSNIYIAGEFTMINGTPGYNNIAMWNGSVWLPLAGGLPGGEVSMLTKVNGILYAGGGFTTASSAPADYIAKWDGSSWSAINSSPINNYVTSFALSGTTLYIVGEFTKGIVSYNTTNGTWSTLGLANNGLNDTVFGIVVNNNDVYVSGKFTTAGGNSANRVARWNGSSWSALGNGIDDDNVYAIGIVNNILYVGGNFTSVNGNASIKNIAQWNTVTNTWSAVGTGLNNSVGAIATYNGILYAGGSFINAGGNITADFIAQWNGSIWSPVSTNLNITGQVNSIIVNNNTLYVCGSFPKFIQTYGPL